MDTASLVWLEQWVNANTGLLSIVLPILALLGFAAMGKTVAHEVAQEDERGYPGGY